MNKGHDAAALIIEHSYFWTLPILIHKTNTNADIKDKTYQCGTCPGRGLLSAPIITMSSVNNF